MPQAAIDRTSLSTCTVTFHSCPPSCRPPAKHAAAHIPVRLDALKRLGLGRGPSDRVYETLERRHVGNNDNDNDGWLPARPRPGASVAWYWRLLALASSLMILGALLILPTSFDNDPDRKISRTAVSLFGLCLLTAGLSFSALVAFSVRHARFQAESLFQPCLIYSAVGLLNVFYDFIVSDRYTWTTPALLLTVAAAIATIAYAVLLVIAQRKAARMTAVVNAGPVANIPLDESPRIQRTTSHTDRTSTTSAERWQDSTYYENFTRNAYPTAYSNTSLSNRQGQPADISESELQQQQMLTLLLQNPRPASTAHGATYHIDWQGHEQEVLSPLEPSNNAAAPAPVQSDRPLQPWDGVWRESPRTVTIPRIERQP